MERRGRPRHPDILTPREWEVLTLLRRGLTNGEIADGLAISERGVKYHVSEIIGKLGVRDRHAAARWQPEEQHKRAPLWALFPLRRRVVYHPATAVGVLGLAIAGAVLAVAVWGPFPVEVGEPEPQAVSALAAPTPTTLQSTQTSVMLFKTGAQPSVRELDYVQGTAFFGWLDGGSRILGYDWRGHSFDIFGVDAGTADRLYDTFAPQPAGNRRTEWARVTPGGASVLLQRDDGPPRIYDVASQTFRPVAVPPGQDVNFYPLPNGVRLMYQNIVDGRSRVMIADLDGGSARVLAESETGNVGFIGEDPVSPDGKRLLMASSDGTAGVQQSSAIVTDIHGAIEWRMAVPDISTGVPTDIRWAGADRLLLTRTQPDGHGGLNVVVSRFIAIPSGVETDAPTELETHLVSISPDGVHAIMLLGDGSAPWERRCSLVEIDAMTGTIRELAAANPAPGDYQTVFCATVDWTPDGSQAIVSAGGI
jgi:DNA-binding CsgD family transcriptional regulator